MYVTVIFRLHKKGAVFGLHGKMHRCMDRVRKNIDLGIDVVIWGNTPVDLQASAAMPWDKYGRP